MVVDTERVLQDLKVHLSTKDSHGRREILTRIGELEAEHTVDEGLPEQALRLFGTHLSKNLTHQGPGQPATSPAPAGNGAHAGQAHQS